MTKFKKVSISLLVSFSLAGVLGISHIGNDSNTVHFVAKDEVFTPNVDRIVKPPA